MTLQPFELNLRHLRAVVSIVNTGSMSAAARAVSLSQPALTQGLAKLEKQANCVLFERRIDGMRPTDDGRILSERVEKAFAHLAEGTRGSGRGGDRGFLHPEQLMTASQIHAFLHLADIGSFVGAALNAGLSQPAIHRAVRDLQQVVGAALVERRGRGVVLTARGRRLSRGIRLASREIEAAIEDISLASAASGKIAIGAMPLSRARLLPSAIAAFAKERPSIQFDIVEGSWRDLVEALRDGKIDLMVGALRLDPEPTDLQQIPLFKDELSIIGRSGHPLAGPDDPSPDALKHYPWIVGSEGSPIRGQWEQMFPNGSRPPAPIICGSVMTIRGILCDSDFLTLLSADQVGLEVKTGVLAHVGQPLADSVRTIGIAMRRDFKPSNLQQAFITKLTHPLD